MIKKLKILVLMVGLLSFLSSVAGEFKTGNPERKRANKEAMSESTFKKFTKLQEMIADSKYNDARAGLNTLLQRRLNSFEKANVNQYLGYIEQAEGHYDKAAQYFQAALDSDALPNQAHFPMMIQVAQMLIGSGSYQKGLDMLHNYYKLTDAIKDNVFALEANAYAQLKQYNKAIPILKKAISLSDKPSEPWNYLLYSLYMETSQYQQAAKTLETLIAINPNKEDYWKRLSGVYFNLKKDDKALATLVVANKNGMLKDEKDRLRLFRMYALLGVPYKAAKVLEQGLKNGVIKSEYKHWKTLGEVWYTAAEMDKSLKAFDEASKTAQDGQIDFRRAYIYFDREDWPNVIEALNSALEKGGLKERKIGQAWLLLGMANSELGKMSKAVDALKKAAKYKSSRNNAVQWLEHIASQQRRARAEAEQRKLLEEKASDRVDET